MLQLPPRNFYQIVYVQGLSRAVIGSSSVFYVERARMPEAKHKMVVVAEDKLSVCMLRNLFCGVADGVEAAPKETKSALLLDEEPTTTQQPLCDQSEKLILM
uniref:tRNA_int_endo_N domain-containing protein n=1 Tax=Steinernema glaseri TaxID=37863 RepID=A0A1I7ZB86_9BILA